jgi:acyl-coenzyme A synthetase/AMP-(fatty) acid ligase
VLVDDKGNEVTGNDVTGNLCLKGPWPGILRTTYGDHERLYVCENRFAFIQQREYQL